MSQQLGESVIQSAVFEDDGEGPLGEATGILVPCPGKPEVGEGRVLLQRAGFGSAWEGLCAGRDSGNPQIDHQREAVGMPARD